MSSLSTASGTSASQANPNPASFSSASRSFSASSSFDEYSGKTSPLPHVCEDGSSSDSPAIDILKAGDKPEKPSLGKRDEPVAKCSIFARSSEDMSSTSSQNQEMTASFSAERFAAVSV